MLFNHHLFFVFPLLSDMQPATSPDTHKPFYELNTCIKEIHIKNKNNPKIQLKKLKWVFSFFFLFPFFFLIFSQLHFILPDSDSLLGSISGPDSKLTLQPKKPSNMVLSVLPPKHGCTCKLFFQNLVIYMINHLIK